MMKKTLLMLLLTFSVCTTFAQEKIKSGGLTRNMIVYAPKNLGTKRPLLISMHGSNQDARYQQEHANYEAVADTAKFVVVYPDGENRGWDIGGMKDVNFILDIIEEMSRRYQIDKNRVYLSGFSMGGMMTYHAMTKIADKIAAFAPVSGYPMGGPNATSSRPIPIIHVHGTSDDVCVYNPVQSHIDAWVKRNKCSTKAEVTKPLSGPSNTSATLIRYRNGLEGVEVAHLKLPGKGHWHSNDPVVAMTNVEIWNFCKRYSLVTGPDLQSLTPENNSFDMIQSEHSKFTLVFDKEVNCDKVKATLTKGVTTIALELSEQGASKSINFTIPESAKLDDGDYSLKVTGIQDKDGNQSSDVTANYTYGIEEVGETLKVDTIFSQDWYSQKELIGEGIPLGWVRVNSRSDGTTDEKKSGEANTGGARMKYFETGGDFNAGFYFSSRDYDVADFYYGSISGNSLILRKGKYLVSFRSSYWNAGAQNDKNTFSLSIINRADNNVLFSEPSISSSGCLGEKSDIAVSGSEYHEIVCNISTPAKCLLQFSISSGWNGIILSEPTITTCPSNADYYKGGFLRTLSTAKNIYDKMQNLSGYAASKTKLETAIAKYETLSSISPSEYTAATNALKTAMQPLLAVGIENIYAEPEAIHTATYDLMGRKVNGTLKKGIYIRNGKKIMVR